MLYIWILLGERHNVDLWLFVPFHRGVVIAIKSLTFVMVYVAGSY